MSCCSRNKKKKDTKRRFENTILINRYRFKPDEISIYKQKFERMSSGSGFTKEEFLKNMSMIGVKAIGTVADHIFSVMNKSRSNCVTIEEYLSYMDIVAYGTPEEKATQNFNIILGPDNEFITYASFAQWFVSVLKMMNKLTGQEVSINSDQIKAYFNQLDLKQDGVIDFEEYSSALTEKSNLLEWIDSLHQGITERINVSSIAEFKKEDPNYSKKIAVIENEIKVLIALIEDQSTEQIVPGKSYAEVKPPLSFRRPERTSTNVFFQGAETDDRQRRATKFSTIKSGRESFSRFDPRFENIKNKLGKLLEKLALLKEKGSLDTDNSEENQASLRRTWTKSITKAIKKNDVIYWGDEDWNLILNMMLGIQKSVKATVASLDSLCEVNSDMFIEKVKHKLLPGQSKGTKTFKFRDYAPTIFERIRKLYGITSSNYIRSLGMEKMMHALMTNEFSSLMGQCTTGKSGSFFYYSDDGKYMLKTLSEEEYVFFRRFIPDYYFHLFKNPHTLITRFFGFHKIIVCSSKKKLYFVVMGNLFKSDYELEIKYDLKGSTLGRITKQSEDKTIARKDNNFNEDKRKICIGKKRKQFMMEQLVKDSELLRRADVIDYSLLVGISNVERKKVQKAVHGFVPFFEIDEGGMISEDHNELYFLGVIDILTHYGVKKKLEHFFKKSIYKKEAVSCAPPEYYMQRFLNYMDQIFI